MGLKIGASGLGFILNVLLARFLGVADFGVYTYALAWRDLLIIPSLLGLDTLMVREVAVYRAKSNWGLLRGLLRWANTIVLVSSIVISLIAIAVVWQIDFQNRSQMILTFCLAMSLLPISALRNVRLAAMKGLKLVFMGLLPEMIFVPILVIGFSAAFYFISDRNSNIYSLRLNANLNHNKNIIYSFIPLFFQFLYKHKKKFLYFVDWTILSFQI